MKKQPVRVEPENELEHEKRLSEVEVEIIDAAAGAAAGAAFGTLGGPVGMATGAALGAVVGAVLGHQAHLQQHEHAAHDEWMDDDAERIRTERASQPPPPPKVAAPREETRDLDAFAELAVWDTDEDGDAEESVATPRVARPPSERPPDPRWR